MMMLVLWVALLLAAQAAPSAPPQAPAPTPPPTETHAAPGAGLVRLIGTWQCDGSATGNSSVQTYARSTDGRIVLHNDVRGSTGIVGSVVETFAYDAANETWTVTAPANTFFDELNISGGAWTGASWTLQGRERARATSVDVRVVYTQVEPNRFRREHQTQVAGVWQDDADYSCRRVSLVLPSRTSPALQHVSTTSRTALPIASPLPVTITPPPTASSPTPASSSPASSSPASSSPAASSTASSSPAPKTSRSTRATSFTEALFLPPVRQSPRPTSTRTPRLAQTRAPSPKATPRDPDRARTLVGGRWICQTIAGNRGTHVYRMLPDGTVALVNVITIGGHAYEIDERYRYDRSHETWNNVTADGAYRGVAPPWLGDDWTFTGVATERGSAQPVRMVYRTLGDDAFRRDFQRPTPNGWVTYTAETCERRS